MAERQGRLGRHGVGYCVQRAMLPSTGAWGAGEVAGGRMMPSAGQMMTSTAASAPVQGLMMILVRRNSRKDCRI